MYAEVVLLFDGFNDQALTVDFEVTAIPDLTTHFGVEGGFIKHQLVIGLTFLSQFSVFENLYVAGGVIVANEVGGSILEYYPVAGFDGSGVASPVFLGLHGGLKAFQIGFQVVFLEYEFGQVYRKSVGVVQGKDVVSRQGIGFGPPGLCHQFVQ
ncbi:MAG: hypothetical protein BWY72_01975 [Bacteroidetes bacterium ADurb.Bin416]|nr:MAG: hypothetical protein BWY72_01975 [Bacteroidetes bacterium ADurb.Bin416]